MMHNKEYNSTIFMILKHIIMDKILNNFPYSMFSIVCII